MASPSFAMAPSFATSYFLSPRYPEEVMVYYGDDLRPVSDPFYYFTRPFRSFTFAHRSFGVNTETRYSDKLDLGNISSSPGFRDEVFFPTSESGVLSFSHATPGGFRWYSNNGVINIPGTYVSFGLSNMGRPYTSAYAFITFTEKNTGLRYAGNFAITDYTNGRVKIYVDAERYENFSLAGVHKNIAEPSSLIARPNTSPLSMWEERTPLDPEFEDANFTYGGEIALSSPELGHHHATLIVPEPGRPVFSLRPDYYWDPAGIIGLEADWEDLSSTPGHSHYNIYTYDPWTGEDIWWELGVTDTTSIFLAYADTTAGLYIEAINKQGNVYASSSGLVQTPGIPETVSAQKIDKNNQPSDLKQMKSLPRTAEKISGEIKMLKVSPQRKATQPTPTLSSMGVQRMLMTEPESTPIE